MKDRKVVATLPGRFPLILLEHDETYVWIVADYVSLHMDIPSGIGSHPNMLDMINEVEQKGYKVCYFKYAHEMFEYLGKYLSQFGLLKAVL